MDALLERLFEARKAATEERSALLARTKAAGQAHRDDKGQHEFDLLSGEIATLDVRISETEGELRRAG